jgi:hypothetical protein
VPTRRQVQPILQRVPSTRQPLLATEAQVPTDSLDRPARGGLASEVTLPVTLGGSGSSFWTGALVAPLLKAWNLFLSLGRERVCWSQFSSKESLDRKEKKQKTGPVALYTTVPLVCRL